MLINIRTTLFKMEFNRFRASEKGTKVIIFPTFSFTTTIQLTIVYVYKRALFLKRTPLHNRSDKSVDLFNVLLSANLADMLVELSICV